MLIDPNADIEITAFEWVPSFAQGQVRDLRPRWACEEYGIAYEVRLISALERPEWYYDEQPWGQVPYVRDGQWGLFESGAILVHLAERVGVLPPPTLQARADILSWLFAAFSSVEPFIQEFVNCTVFNRKEEWAKLRLPSLEQVVDKRLERLQQALGEKEWLAGEFSIADIAMVSVLRPIKDAAQFQERPALWDYVARAEGRPAFARALEAQLAVFAQHEPAPQTAR
ncbi:glutathione S-transferase family protein [Novosphingobium sp. Leaf2]|uniref:glutathione S-transferase family protein n=1 Tax=Novosphingobium sp. Leaf2 TaxID=1735670 RepID=UPI0006F7338F|nr:glutathione S-transferase family protein [Novosphingobium sp. Leaf2]KQM17535.1 glutathione S-transferase [Novosphingobium sp. Leaf2]